MVKKTKKNNKKEEENKGEWEETKKKMRLVVLDKGPNPRGDARNLQPASSLMLARPFLLPLVHHSSFLCFCIQLLVW